MKVKNSMSTWNYRMVAYRSGRLKVHEVYYDEGGDVEFWSVKDYTHDYAMEEAMERPVLSEEDLPSEE